MTSIPASRNARATTLAPRSWPSNPGFAMSTRIGVFFATRAFAIVDRPLTWVDKKSFGPRFSEAEEQVEEEVAGQDPRNDPGRHHDDERDLRRDPDPGDPLRSKVLGDLLASPAVVLRGLDRLLLLPRRSEHRVADPDVLSGEVVDRDRVANEPREPAELPRADVAHGDDDGDDDAE